MHGVTLTLSLTFGGGFKLLCQFPCTKDLLCCVYELFLQRQLLIQCALFVMAFRYFYSVSLTN